MKLQVLVPALTVLGATLVAGAARGQCSTWSKGFARPGLQNVWDTAAFDSGAGQQLHVCGGTANGRGFIDRWTGERWENAYTTPAAGFHREMGAGTLQGTPAIFLSDVRPGGARVIVRWDGATATDLGAVLGGEVYCIEVLDDGSGPALFIGGEFTTVAGVANPRLAKWNGSSWTALGGGLPVDVGSVTVHDDGSGPKLCAGSELAFGGPSVLVRNGVTWTSLGAPASQWVGAMASHDWGTGPQLVIAASGGFNVWNGSSWSQPSGGTGSSIALALGDLGSGTRAYFMGAFTSAGGVPCLNAAAYTGSNYEALGAGIQPGVNYTQSEVTWVQEASGPKVYFSGQLTQAGGTGAQNLAAWDGSNWSAFGSGFNGPVDALASFDLGTGSALYASGAFSLAGGAIPPLAGSARWNGTQWSALPGAPGFVQALQGSTVGGSPRLFATGRFNTAPYFGLAAWNGSNWSTVGGGIGNGIGGEGNALLEHDDGSGPRLFVGGNFPLGNPAPGNRIAAWDGASWSPLAGGMNNLVNALARFDEGAGAELFAAGAFTLAGGAAANRIARWNGSAWSSLGSGFDNMAMALCTFDGGAGEALYAGGTFTSAGGVPVQYLARWNGSAWSDVPGGGANGAVLTLAVHDDGRGPALYVGGGFTTIGGITAYNIARFDGAAWETVDGGFDGAVHALAAHDDDGDGDAELFVGGGFQTAGPYASGFIARLGGCPHHTSFCFGDGALADHTTPCPCANDGLPGRGCANPFDPNGALLEASGSTNPDTLVLAGSGTPLSAFGIYLQHAALDDRVFHDGVLCAGGNLIRLRNRVAVGGMSTYPDSTDTLTVSQRGQVTPGSGATRYYSLFYRSASPAFCPPATANVTNGVRVIW